ncbi:MAG: hypothetical protein U0625_12340 [Phycisphaerales bacterium]
MRTPDAKPPHAGAPTGTLARALFRACVVITLVGFFAAATIVVRGLVGGFGREPATLVGVALVALLGGIVLLPTAMIVDLPDALAHHWLPERRYRRGRCPGCGYSLARALPRCPECGATNAPPVAYASDWGTLRRALRLAAPAWMLGTIVGLVLIDQDETRFREEVAALRARDSSATAYARRRAQPARFATMEWSAARGFAGPPPFESPKYRVGRE